MHAVLLLASAAAVSAQAGVFHQIAANKRAFSGAHAPQVKARQASSDVATATASDLLDDPTATDTCLSPLMSIYDSLPTPPAELLDYTATDTFTDLCSYTYPASLTAAVSSYSSELISWLSAESSSIVSLVSDCTTYSDLLSLTDISSALDTASCGATGSGAKATATGGTATPTGSNSNSNSNSNNNNAASGTTGSGSGSIAAPTNSALHSSGNATGSAAPQEAASLARAAVVAAAAGALVMAAL